MSATLSVTTRACPNCDAYLTRGEFADGWCESCGKRLPAYVTGGQADYYAVAGREAPARTRKLASVALFVIAGMQLLASVLLAVVWSLAEETRPVLLGLSRNVLGLVLVAEVALGVVFAGLGVLGLFRPRVAAAIGLVIYTPLTILAVINTPIGLLVIKYALIACLVVAVRGEPRPLGEGGQ